MALRHLVARPLADFGAALDAPEDSIVYGASCDDTLFAAARTSRERPVTEHAHAKFPKTQLDQPNNYRVVAWRDGELRVLNVRDEPLLVSYVQPLAGGVLLVGARCQWRPEGPENNGAIYDWNGRLRNRICLGDGIADVRTTPDGAIWASYFDEGIFGNYGWGHPGPAPIGVPGLVSFDTEGHVRYRYDAEKAHTDHPCDVYALNVTGNDDVWLYFYTEFALVHVTPERTRSWLPGVSGARALAVRESRVLLLGDYANRAEGRILDLPETGAAPLVEKVLIVDSNDVPLGQATAFGVADALYLFQDRRALVVREW